MEQSVLIWIAWSGKASKYDGHFPAAWTTSIKYERTAHTLMNTLDKCETMPQPLAKTFFSFIRAICIIMIVGR